MKILKEWPLKGAYKIALVDQLGGKAVSKQFKYLLNDVPMVPRYFGISARDQVKLKKKREQIYKLYNLDMAIFKGSELVGWTMGWQDSFEQDTFIMAASVIVPKHRRQGLYSLMVKKVFEIAKSEGFQTIISTHIITNNPVIIAKLNLGFHIYGMETNTRYGQLVRLVHHLNKMKQKALRFRAGAVGESEVLSVLLGK
jgi:GNAT superfamily N-acetyltransferase